MKKVIAIKNVILAIGLVCTINLLSQEAEEKKEAKPVRKPFNANQLIDLQTVVQPKAKSMELIIHHRFGTFENKFSDLFGIYASSNIRLGLNYGITDRLMVGIGTEKDNKLQDIQWKYKILEQTTTWSIPVSISYYGNMAINANNKVKFGEGDVNISTRMSYFHQLLISSKISDKLSVMIASGFSHVNMVVDTTLQNDVVSASLGVKYSITKKMAVVSEYDHPFFIKKAENKYLLPEPNLGVALEIGTSTHIFQITLSQYREINAQQNSIYNKNSFSDKGWVLGFNINVKF